MSPTDTLLLREASSSIRRTFFSIVSLLSLVFCIH
jgi:hypothetical protein